jgi:ABC-2 type transport system ATP-binding protein
MAIIEVNNLIKYFGKTKAVDGISFSVEKGEIFGFLGPNGAGKTTTIRCMMDFIRPDHGTIKILGLNAQENSVTLKSKIGYLSGNANFYEHWSARDHLNFQQALRGKSKIVNNLVERFGLNLKSKFGILSSGNKQKLSIVLALMNEPEVLILDEPTLSLDPLLQNSTHSYLQDFAARGGTVFMSSHNLSEVEKVCDRVGIIRKGKIVAVQKIKDLKLARMYYVHIISEQKINTQDFAAKNIKIISQMDNSLTLKVKGEIQPLLEKLSQIKIKDVEINHVSLEDIFMEFYENKGDKK